MLEIKNVYKTYTSKNGVSYRALENISLKFPSTGLCFILGKSGSGKSTLLNLIGGLDNFDRGEITYNGQNFSEFSVEDFEYYRNLCVGFVFQDFCLLDNLTALENVKLALSLQNKNNIQECLEALKKVGVEHLKNRKISELTGGQKQRIAIARAIVKKAKIILADEPTGSLDSDSSNDIMNLLANLSKDSLVIIVTHNKELANEYAKRIIEIQDGFILKDMAIKQEDENTNDKINMMYSSSLLYLPKGNEISNDEVNELNTIMQEKRQDYYFLVEQNKERIVSMYPNMKEVFFPSRKEDKFIPYRYVKDEIDENKINKNCKTMSYMDSLKFGRSLTKKRKGKLFLSIIITIITIVIMGLLSNFANYNLEEAISVSLKNDSSNYLEVSSSFSVSDENYKIQSKDLKILDDLGYEYAKKYDVTTTFNSNSDFKITNARKDALFTGTFAGFIETEDLTKLGYDYLYQSENLDINNGLNISSVVASTIVYYNIASSMEELIDKKVIINGNDYVISGIFDTNHEKYDAIRDLKGSDYETLLDEYNYIKNEFILRLVVNHKFMENYIEEFGRFNTNIEAGTTNVKNSFITIKTIDDTSIYNAEFTTEFDDPYRYDVLFEKGWTEANYKEKLKTQQKNEIFVGSNAFKSLTNTSFDVRFMDNMKKAVADFNNGSHTLIIRNRATNTSPETYSVIENVKILGVFPSFSSVMLLSHEAFVEVTNSFFKPSSIFLMPKSNSNYNAIVNNLYDNGFVIDNEMVSYLVALVDQIQSISMILKVGLIVWLVIVALLFYSFMSKSIQENIRQIGILKALGSTGKDIYKIFTYEALLLAIFAICGGAIIYVITSIIANKITSIGLDFYYPLLIINVRTILTMVLPTFAVLILALIIPISKANKIKPIEVMNRE